MKVKEKDEIQVEFPAYPLYPAEEDVYNKMLIEEDIDPEDISKNKVIQVDLDQTENEDEGEGVINSIDELDIPGTELDDEQEEIGEEDEENNYYSLGGDDHSNLDEN
jgi:hypothetical protein